MTSADNAPTTHPPDTQAVVSFSYRAQTAGGEPLAGSIDGHDLDDVRRQLTQLGLRVIDIQSVTRIKPKPLRGDDFAAFNQQLGQLVSAGLPLEQGLRLIAQDMRTGRLARTVNLVAEELERGVPLGEAFGKHQGQFPPLYGQLMDAGIRTGNLPAMLLNLSRYTELVQRLRGMMWRAVSYPLMVTVGLIAVLLFISTFVLPKFEAIFKDFKVELPAVTKALLSMNRALPTALLVVAIGIVLWMILLPVLRRRNGGFIEAAVLPIPLIGPVFKRSLIARWCDAMKLSVDASMDLPSAIKLAQGAIGSTALRRDGETLLEWFHASPTANDPPRNLRILPATVPAAMALATHQNQLSETLATLVQMYAQQAEQRMVIIPSVLGPLLLATITVVVGFILLAIVAPMIALIQTVSGG